MAHAWGGCWDVKDSLGEASRCLFIARYEDIYPSPSSYSVETQISPTCCHYPYTDNDKDKDKDKDI